MIIIEKDQLPDPNVQLNSMFSSISRFTAYLWKNKVIIFILVLIGGVSGALYNYYKDAKYTAKLTFALDEESGMGGYANLAEQFGISLGSGAGGAFKGENLLELFKSRYIIEKTLLAEGEWSSKKDLFVNYLITTEYPKRFKDPHFNNGVKTTYHQDSIINVLHELITKNMLEVSRTDKRLIYVDVSVKSKDMVFSKNFVEKLLDNVIGYYVETKTMKAKKTVDLMTKELDSVKMLMTGAIYQSARGTDLNVNPVKQIVRAPVQRSTADAQVYGIAYGEIMKNLELAKMNLMKETPLVQVIDRPVLPLKKEKKGRLLGFIVWGFVSFLLVLSFFYVRYLFYKRRYLNISTQ